jgi:hypothetical protein
VKVVTQALTVSYIKVLVTTSAMVVLTQLLLIAFGVLTTQKQLMTVVLVRQAGPEPHVRTTMAHAPIPAHCVTVMAHLSSTATNAQTMPSWTKTGNVFVWKDGQELPAKTIKANVIQSAELSVTALQLMTVLTVLMKTQN